MKREFIQVTLGKFQFSVAVDKIAFLQSTNSDGSKAKICFSGKEDDFIGTEQSISEIMNMIENPRNPTNDFVPTRRN